MFIESQRVRWMLCVFHACRTWSSHRLLTVLNLKTTLKVFRIVSLLPFGFPTTQKQVNLMFYSTNNITSNMLLINTCLPMLGEGFVHGTTPK